MPWRPIIIGRSQALRRGRISTDYGCYSITKKVAESRQVLSSAVTARIIFDSWRFLRERDRIKLFAFCLMPDHFHMTMCLMPGESLSNVFEDSSKFTAREINKVIGRRGHFWQEGFHDHQCRNESELHDLSLYIEHNPVRAGLVTAAELWPYSSAYPANQDMLDRDWWP